MNEQQDIEFRRYVTWCSVEDAERVGKCVPLEKIVCRFSVELIILSSFLTQFVVEAGKGWTGHVLRYKIDVM